MDFTHSEFLDFLITAKVNTYASQEAKPVVVPLLPGSKQLEYTQDQFLYRDIYFGGESFIGQETVYYKGEPIWAMAYAGGLMESVPSVLKPIKIYNFLKKALRLVSPETSYRGPKHYQNGDFTYIDRHEVENNLFWGTEAITFQGQPVYTLHYSGGSIK
jgi:hypothetical protein